MTNYQSTSYHVEDGNEQSMAFTVLPANSSTEPIHADEAVLKAWSTQELPDGQPINVAVEFSYEDIRGLQAFLNDQFGRGRTEKPVDTIDYYPDNTTLTAPMKPGDLVAIQVGDETFHRGVGPDGQQLLADGTVQVKMQPVPEAGWGTAPDGAATWNPLEAQRAAEALGGDQAAENFLTGIKQASDAIQQMQRQCPHISNGVQCAYAEHGLETMHSYEGREPQALPNAPAWAFPQTGDGAVTPPAAPMSTPAPTGGEQVAESATVVGATEAPSPSLPYLSAYEENGLAFNANTPPYPECPLEGCSDLRPHYHRGDDSEKVLTPRAIPEERCWCGGPVGPREPGDAVGLGCLADVTHNWQAASQESQDLIEAEKQTEQPAKKKVNRRKKEEKAYDDALEAFRAQPTSQLAYTDLVKAAEALRKRFPDAERLVSYDLHVQHQDIKWLTDPEYGIVSDDPAKNEQEQNAASSAAGQNVPHFAPEPVAEQPGPFVPPALDFPVPEQQSPEEVAAAQAFPCQHRSSDGRQCTRPAGHELADPPKPHIYPTDLHRLGAQAENLGFTSTPVGVPVSDGQGFTQSTIPPFQIPQPTQVNGEAGFVPAPVQPSATATVLSFQVPPTPDGAELQPPAPAAPPWGGQS